MSKEQKGKELDLFTPILEIIHELGIEFFVVLKESLVWVFYRISNKPMEIRKIKREELKNRKTSKNAESLGIDTKTKRDILLSDIDFTKHSFIVGASGYGKTNLISMLQESNLKANKPIIFIDPKGDLGALNTFKNLCERYKRTCYVFSEHFEDSISLNPVLEGSIGQVSERIMQSFEWSEQFYKTQARRSLNQALKKIQTSGQVFSLKRIYDALVEMESKDNLGLIVQLENILESDFGKILSDDEGLSFSQVREQRACLYIGLSTQGYGETAVGIGKLFLNELLFNSYSTLITDTNEAKISPISVYFDEFGAIVTKQFIELQNKCRGAGIELTMAVQTIADINTVNPELTNQIIENANNVFILKQRLEFNATYFAESIGTIISKKVTFQTENGERSEMGTEREVQELIVHPDIIKNLRVGQCILLRQSPTQVNLINIRNRQMEAFKKLNQYIKDEKITLGY